MHQYSWLSFTDSHNNILIYRIVLMRSGSLSTKIYSNTFSWHHISLL